MTKKQKKLLRKIIIASAGLIVINLLSKFLIIKGQTLKDFLYGLPLALAYIAIYCIVGGNILIKAFKGILNRKLFDENFLMTIATIGAFALAVYDRSGDYNEAIFVMLFYQIGELFQSIAVGKSRKNISDLMDIRPDYANIEKDGQLIQVSPRRKSSS